MDVDKLTFLVILIIGFAGWVVHYIFIITAVFSKEKWLIWIDYNIYHEGWFEVILITIIICFYIIVLIII